MHMRLSMLILLALMPWQIAMAQDDAGALVEDPEGIVEDVDSDTPADKTPAVKVAPKEKKQVAEPAGNVEEKPVPEPEPQSVYTNGIALQGLNKVTARIQTLDGPIGTVLRFGNLEIIPRRCWKSSPESQPENAALLEIWELKPGEGPQQIFMGWMFSSSPGLSSLQHPVYDISVLACENRKAED